MVVAPQSDYLFSNLLLQLPENYNKQLQRIITEFKIRLLKPNITQAKVRVKIQIRIQSLKVFAFYIYRMVQFHEKYMKYHGQRTIWG